MIRLKEVVPFSKSPDIERKLREKYKDLDEDTFGIDMEFHTNDPRESSFSPDPYDYIDDFEYKFNSSRQAQMAFEEWLEDHRNSIARTWYGKINRWDDSYGPVDTDNWDEYNPEPEVEDFKSEDDYEEAHTDWESEREGIESDYQQWERKDKPNLVHSWISDLVENDEWENYFSIDSDEYEPRYNSDYEESILNVIDDAYKSTSTSHQSGWESLLKSGWDVGKDEGDIVEIRTPPMKYTKENLSVLEKIMWWCYNNMWASGDTSAHIHIGLSEDFTIFDLLAMTTLVDEAAVKKDISPDRMLSEFSRLAPEVHKNIIKAIQDYLDKTGERKIEQYVGRFFIVENSVLQDSVQSFFNRHAGTNIKSFLKNKTMEFRYFSSQIAPYFGKFEQWIRYFMLIPKVAQGRNQFIIGKDEQFPLIFTRVEKGKTKITILEKGGKMPKSTGLPSQYLRSKSHEPEDNLLKRLKKKFSELPKSSPKEMSKNPLERF